jgi:hypothetical protein
MNIVYVLLLQHDDASIRQEIWVATTQREAAKTLRNYAEDFLTMAMAYDVDDMPADEDLVPVLRENGERVHVFECGVDGLSSGEIDPFLRNRAALRHGVTRPPTP